jgi:hypothetical protein
MNDIFTGSASVRTSEGILAGSIDLDGIEKSALFDSQGPFEFILLSVTEIYDRRSSNPAKHEKYFVMLLEWNGQIAERRGLGVIDKSAILQSFPPGPQWKEIVLG